MDKCKERTLNLVDEKMEYIDPNPDIHELFLLFDQQFFFGTLSSHACTVEWSKRMTSCAGICQFNAKSGLCCVRLSEPLLKLRKRKDLVETLLHEMIHGYIFLTAGMRFMDRDGHGPEFQNHMHRINAMAGTSITIYHSFHAEVSHYKQHWWRCTGPCKDRNPYYGWVKRATNRAPCPNDFWWKEHQLNCNGSFVKVKEPEKKEKLPKSKASTVQSINNNNAGTSKGNKQKFKPLDHRQPKIDQIFPGKGHVLGELNSTQNDDGDEDFTIIADIKRPRLNDKKPIFPGKGNLLGNK